MLYDKWGTPLVITKSLGSVQPPGFVAPVRLVAVQVSDPVGDETYSTYRFAEFLKADGGINEVDEAIAAAPVAVVPPSQLELAIKKAL